MESNATKSPNFIRVPKKRRRKGQTAQPSQTLRDGIRKNESIKKKSVKSLKKREDLKKSSRKSRITLKNGKKKQIRRTSVQIYKRKKIILTRRILRHRRRKNFDKKYKVTRGVVYLSHVPHGFYDKEMTEFFSQFGTVTNVNIPRSNRTGKYKGYAFVEFKYEEVAKVVAETMNNYLMFQKVLKTKYIPPEEQKPMCFRFRKCKVPLLVRRQKYLRSKSNRERNEKETVEENKRLQANLKKKANKLEKLGINYEFQVDDTSVTT